MMLSDDSFNVQTFINLPVPREVHDLTHGNPSEIRDASGSMCEAVADFYNFNVDMILYLAKKLHDTPEGNGTALDNTVLTFIIEGSAGEAPHEVDPGATNQRSSHSTENCVVLVIGGKNGGLKHGQHINGNKRHPGQVIQSALQAIHPSMSFGEMASLYGTASNPNGVIEEMFS